MTAATNLIDAMKILNPQKPLEIADLDAFYVSRSARVIGKIQQDLKSDPRAKILFTGHRGAGKSTELAKLEKELHNFWIVRYSAQEKLDVNDLNYVDILLSIPLQILNKAEEERISISKNVVRRAEIFGSIIEKEILDEQKAAVEVKGSLKDVLWSFFSLEGRLSKEVVTREKTRIVLAPRITELEDLIADLVKDIEAKTSKKVLLMVEDLDKTDLEVSIDLFYKHGSSLSRPPVAIIYTFPIALLNDAHVPQIEANGFRRHSLPNFKIKNKDESDDMVGISCMLDLLKRRVDPQLFKAGTLERLVHFSGGVPRKLIYLTREACAEADLESRSKVEMVDVDAAISAERITYQRFLTVSQILLLKEVKANKNLDKDLEYAKLVHNISVLEYLNGEYWIDIYPPIEKLLL